MRAFHALGLDAAIGQLLSARDRDLGPPGWTRNPEDALPAMRMTMMGGDKDHEALRAMRRAAAQEENARIRELRRWWLERMRSGSQPLVEKMTLFWHGHFATSIIKVKSSWMMWRQNQTFRENALGGVGEILQATTRDPAMIRWLDLARSRAGAPNENFAREVMELFALGVGNYSEDDVKAAARAFTGHRINPATMEFAFSRRLHDDGEKTFLGRTGRFDGDDIIGIILEQPACSRFLAGRIWEFFVYEDPSPATVEAAAFVLRSSGYQVRPLLAAIFRSREFYSKPAMRTHIKSPVEWLVQTCVALETDLPESPALDNMLEQMGQSLFAPPNVRGWEGGRSWISSSTLVLRYNLAGYLVGSNDPAAKRLFKPRLHALVDPDRLAPRDLRSQPAALAESLTFRFFGTAQPGRLRDRTREELANAGQPLKDRAVRKVVSRLLSSPDFQLS
jgi:uncharacterized protein (DUF1800 family)